MPGSWRVCDTATRGPGGAAVKLITGQTVNTTQPLTGLANQLHDGNVHALADSVNRFFQGVAADLRPLDDSSMPPPPDAVPDEFTIGLEDVEPAPSPGWGPRGQGPRQKSSGPQQK